jgi:uncharacterized membrane protein
MDLLSGSRWSGYGAPPVGTSNTITNDERSCAMSTVEADTVVDVPTRVAYNQWTRFEEFPEFLPGIDEVTQITDTKLHWVVSPAGVTREYDAVITEQVPDQVIAWESIDEPRNAGRVTFEPEDQGSTRVRLVLEWSPEGFVEEAGAALQADDAMAKVDLAKFKDRVESSDRNAEGWRGEVHGNA